MGLLEDSYRNKIGGDGLREHSDAGTTYGDRSLRRFFL
jgi:hypothetical protein